MTYVLQVMLHNKYFMTQCVQVLSELDIVVPLQLLIGMFSDGVNSVKELANQRKTRGTDLTGNAGARRV